MTAGRRSVLVWNGRVARVTVGERSLESPGGRECPQAPEHAVLADDEGRTSPSYPARERGLLGKKIRRLLQ